MSMLCAALAYTDAMVTACGLPLTCSCCLQHMTARFASPRILQARIHCCLATDTQHPWTIYHLVSPHITSTDAE